MTWSISTSKPPVVEVQGDATAPVSFAAAELARYLEQVLGVSLPSACADDGPRIVLERIGDDDLGDEGYELSAEGNTLRIRGGGDAGVVYGVYEFLRRWCGCRFSGLGPDGEHVPRRGRVEFEGGPVRMKPNLWYRGLQLSRGSDLELTVRWLDWMAKNVLNYVIYRPSREGSAVTSIVDPATGEKRRVSAMTDIWFDRHVAPEAMKRGLKLDMNHHNFFYWLPPEEYFDEHPEWYALVDGERVAERRQLSICASNAEGVAQLIENVKAFLREHPEVKVVGVIPEDGWGMCQCDQCAAEDSDPDERFRGPQNWREGGANRAKIDRYARLLNRVAQAIRDEFPDTLVGGAAYIDMTWPSDTVRLEPNIVIWVALYWRDAAHVISEDSPSEVNRRFCDALKLWRKALPGRLITYSYYMGMNAQKSLPYPMDEIICRSWPGYRAMGVEGATIQCWPSNHDVYSLNLLAFARSAWEDEADPAALLDEYLEGMFGSVASVVKPIFDAFHDAWRRAGDGVGDLSLLPVNQGHPCSRGVSITPNGRSIMFLMGALGRDRLSDILRRAQEEAADDRERGQVEKLAHAAEYWRMAAEAFAAERESKAAQEKGDEVAARALQAEAVNRIDDIIEYVAGASPGWMGVTTQRSWRSERTALEGG